MFACSREVMEPSIKLSRMITLLKILAFIHVALIVADFFIEDFGKSFSLLVELIALMVGISSKFFAHYLSFIFLDFIIIGYYLIRILICFQRGDFEDHNYFAFGFISFILMFEIFCVYVVFQVYKQSKHEYRIKFGFAPEDNINGNNDQNNDDLEDLINDNNNEDNIYESINDDEDNNYINNNQDEFAPLQGNQIPEGGNQFN